MWRGKEEGERGKEMEKISWICLQGGLSFPSSGRVLSTTKSREWQEGSGFREVVMCEGKGDNQEKHTADAPGNGRKKKGGNQQV